jgi:hypothetical protein
MKTTSHRLSLDKEGLEKFCLHLSGFSLMESKLDEKRTQYLMPDGKTRLQIRKVETDTYLDITTTTFFKPFYIQGLIGEIEGEKHQQVSSSSSPNKPGLSWLYAYANGTLTGEQQ